MAMTATPPVVINLVDMDSPRKDHKKPSLYSQWCIHLLTSDFPRVSVSDLRGALKFHQGRLIPAYMAIASAYSNSLPQEQKSSGEGLREPQRTERWLPYTGLKLLKVQRLHGHEKPNNACPLFQRDLSSLKVELSKPSTTLKSKLNLDYMENTSPIATITILKSDNIECGCCCNDVPLEEMVQCADGHLFCSACLRRRVEESTYGGLPAFGPLLCIDMAGCDKTIPLSEIRRAVQAELFVKFEERQAHECVTRAKIDGLAYCPSCNFACELDGTLSVLKCPEPSCGKESCVMCKEPSHVPLRCEEVEKPLDTLYRNEIEEIMSRSVVRQCVSCKTELVKDDGCNKITCRCGQSMCYVCRKAITQYTHFCEHVRSPGKTCTQKTCTQCKKCSLWEQEDEDAVVINAKRKALASRAVENVSIIGREIGPSDTFFKKKRNA